LWRSSLRGALGRSWADRRLFLEAWVRLGVVRLEVLALPGRVVLSRLGEARTETTRDDDPAALVLVQRVRWALAAASRRAPWRCKCLEQAIAGQSMLGARGISTTLYLGVARNDVIEAHAWLRCGSLVVTGENEAGRFAVVSTFGRTR
jgi:hypothetical protein